LLPRGSYSPEIVYSYTVIKYCVSVIKVYAETMQNASKNLDSSIQEIKRTGVFEEASELLRVARENKSSMSEMTSAVKEMQVSITALRNELKHIFW
jgi:NAD-specific glutamate dehydrogenase